MKDFRRVAAMVVIAFIPPMIVVVMIASLGTLM
jgi:hypothetical protein